MKVLVDTCVWSLALRRRGAVLNAGRRRLVTLLKEAIRDGRVVLVGPVRQEILSGVKDPRMFTRLEETLRAFPDESVATADYVEAARLYNLCRGHGVICGPVDILLCTLALTRSWRILTEDGGILRCCAAIEKEEARHKRVRKLVHSLGSPTL